MIHKCLSLGNSERVVRSFKMGNRWPNRWASCWGNRWGNGWLNRWALDLSPTRAFLEHNTKMTNKRQALLGSVSTILKSTAA